MFGTHTFHSVRQQQYDAALSDPLTFAAAYELIDDALSVIRKITELCFPNDQRIRIGHAVTELKAENGCEKNTFSFSTKKLLNEKNISYQTPTMNYFECDNVLGLDKDAPMEHTRTYLLPDDASSDDDEKMCHVPHLVQICVHGCLKF